MRTWLLAAFVITVLLGGPAAQGQGLEGWPQSQYSRKLKKPAPVPSTATPPGQAVPPLAPVRGSGDAEALSAQAEAHQQQGRYREAEALLQEALKLAEAKAGGDRPETALVLARLGDIERLLGRDAAAEAHQKRAIAILEKTAGPEHAGTARSLDYLAKLYLDMDRFAEAGPLAARALAIREKKLGPDHPDTANSLDTAGRLLIQQLRYGDAEAPLTRALAIREKALGAEHADTAVSLYRLFALRNRQDRIPEAEAFAQRALAIREKVLPPEHPDLAASLDSIAAIYVARKTYAAADPLARRAFAIREKALGAEHPVTLSSADRLASLHMLRKRLDEAEPLVRSTLEIRERVLGPDHPDVADSLDSLVSIHIYRAPLDTGPPGKLLRRILTIREKAYGPQDRRFAESLSRLARYTDDPSEAEALNKRALSILQQALGAAHPETIKAQTALLKVYQRQGRGNDATALGEKLLADLQAQGAADGPALVNVLDMLAEFHAAAGNKQPAAKAITLQERALAIREKMLGTEHNEIIERLMRLATTADDAGQRQEAEEYYKRALSIAGTLHGPNSPQSAYITARVARFYGSQRKFADADPLFQRYMEITKELLRKDSRISSLPSDMIAFEEMYSAQNRLAELEPVYQELLAISDSVNKDGDLDHTIFIKMLAEFYGKLNRFPEAEKLYLRYLAANEKAYAAGNEKANIVYGAEGLASIYEKEKRYTDIEALYKRALALAEKVHGADAIEILPSLYKLQRFYTSRETQNHAAAETAYKRALAVSQKVNGPDAPKSIYHLDHLAEFYSENGREAEAEPLLKHALSIRENIPAPKGLNAITQGSVEDGLKKLAALYLDTERYTDALPLLERRLAIVEKKSGPDSGELVQPLVDLGGAHDKLENVTAAEDALKRAFAIETKALSDNVREYFRSRAALEALDSFYQKRHLDAQREAFLKVRLSLEEKALASGLITRLSAPHSLFLLYRDQQRYDDCEAIRKYELAALEKTLGPEDRGVLGSLGLLADYYRQQGRNAEAGALLERAYRIQVKLGGPESNETLRAFAAVANSYRLQGRLDEAEQAYGQIVAILEKNAKPDWGWFYSYTTALDGLVHLYKGAGRMAEVDRLFERAAPLIEGKGLAPAGQNVSETHEKAVRFYSEHFRYAGAKRVAKQWLALKEAGSPPEAMLAPLTALGTAHRHLAEYAEAEPYLKRALAISEQVHGAGSSETIGAILSLAALHQIQARYTDAEALKLRALEIAKTLDAKASATKNAYRRTISSSRTRSDVATCLYSLANLREAQGRYFEAEEMFKQSADINEKQFGRRASQAQLDSLGTLYAGLGRYADAEPLLKRSLEFSRSYIGGDEHPSIAGHLDSLGWLYLLQGRYSDAEPLLRQAHGILERVNGPSHPTALGTLSKLARVQAEQKRPAEAEALMKRVAAGMEKVYGAAHPSTHASLQNLFAYYLDQNRLAEAGALAERLQTMTGKVFGPEDKDGAYSRFLLARLEEMRGNWREAWQLRKDASALLIHSIRQRNASVTGPRAGENWTETRYDQNALIALVRSTAQAAAQEPERMPALADEAFQTVQWARHSQAAAALAQTSARFSKGDGRLAELVRKREDLIGQFKAADSALSANLASEDENEQWEVRQARREQIWSDRSRLDAAIQAADAELKEAFPDYAALASPEPLPLAEAQSHLRPGEALYQIAFDREAAYAWVITRDTMQWKTLPLSASKAAEMVAALRCGLDARAWEHDPETAAAPGPQADQPPMPGCRQLTGVNGSGALPPFDLARAHELYKALFAPFEDLIRDKHLFAVPPGILASLPLQVLVTEAPDPSLKGDERYAKAAWLASRQPVTVLPSVASLRVLRMPARKRASLPYTGFGNPLLTGENGQDRRAWSRAECRGTPPQMERSAVQVALAGNTAAVPRGGLQTYYRGGLGNVELIRRQAPLPETAEEMCRVAEALGGEAADVFLGARASEMALKAYSRDGRLGAVRVVHFATHGLIGGETEMLTKNRLEPALILTPPDHPTEEDDGLLTASEAAQLKLNADIVILSACNTAAGDGRAGEALSGLARAFLYAGSRSLLASHWYVNSEAAVELVTGMFAETTRTPGIGHAEALRRTMAASIRAGGTRAHPSYWAPFTVVGDGG